MKRKRAVARVEAPDKRVRVDDTDSAINNLNASFLRHYYTNVCTLRHYILCRIPKSAKVRRRRVVRHGLEVSNDDERIKAECRLLDTTLIGSQRVLPLAELESIETDISIYTQKTASAPLGATQRNLHQAEVIDYCLYRVGTQISGNRVSNLLCQGRFHPDNDDTQYDAVNKLKLHPWTILPDLIGGCSNKLLVDLFCECGVFVKFRESSNLVQVSGQPVSDLKLLTRQDVQHSTGINAVKPRSAAGTRLSDVRIARYRMLYSRPERRQDGSIAWCLTRKHILNRLGCVDNRLEAIRVARYIFPHQFKLRSIFTSGLNSAGTKASLLEGNHSAADIHDGTIGLAVSKRLREVIRIVSRIRARHCRTAFCQLLNHYCPKPAKHCNRSTSLATRQDQVSAFCRASILDVFGRECFGSIHNLQKIQSKIDHFIKLRRFETMSLHEILDGIRILDIPWLAPPRAPLSSLSSSPTSAPLSGTDLNKRKSLLAEMLHFLFNCFLISLIKGHFHVTEASSHRNRLFYFRHDVWQALSTPVLRELRANMLEKVTDAELIALNHQKIVGVNSVRLVPKESGMRPVINLRRRVIRQQHGKTTLGMSVNSSLQSVFQAMNYERQVRPNLLGTSLFSVADMLPLLQTYRSRLTDLGTFGRPLYFAKVDVTACFDSLPQDKVMEVIRKVLIREQYAVKRYNRGKLLNGKGRSDGTFGAKPSWKYAVQACESHDQLALKAIVAEQTTAGRSHSIFIDGRRQRAQSRRQILETLREHIEANLIKVGKSTYRQSTGIAQGSIVSSLLCNLLYTEMQRETLSFTERQDTILLRLIDDFLLITPCKTTAQRFMQVMHAGIAEYGVQIKGEKSLTNFAMDVEHKLGQTTSSANTDFPYCGHTINTTTLDIGKDMERAKKSSAQDASTVEFSRLPGQNFHFKTLTALRTQMKGALISTAHNSTKTVMCNLFDIFGHVSEKCYHYVRAMRSVKRPSSELIIKVMADTIREACDIMRVRGTDESRPGSIRNAHVRWLACRAYSLYLRPRQTRHGQVLAWLHEQLRSDELNRVAPELMSITAKR